MKRLKEGEEWHAKISYNDKQEDIYDPNEVEMRIREGGAVGPFPFCQLEKKRPERHIFWIFSIVHTQIHTHTHTLAHTHTHTHTHKSSYRTFCKPLPPNPCFPAQDEMAGVGVGISDDLISLDISSPDVPDLTLIDLPGIARVAVKGQPENIGEQVKAPSL